MPRGDEEGEFWDSDPNADHESLIGWIDHIHLNVKERAAEDAFKRRKAKKGFGFHAGD